MFSFITIKWRGKPLTSYQVIVELVAGTTTETGLGVLAEWDQGYYPTGVEVTDAELAGLPLAGHESHREWNYDLNPRKAVQAQLIPARALDAMSAPCSRVSPNTS